MSSPYKTLDDGIIPLTPAADYSTYEGYGVTISGDTATLSASATTVAKGVIVVPGTVAQGVTVALLGATNGAVKVKLGGSVTKGAYLQQSDDGTWVTDAGTGNRVLSLLALETGVSGDLIDACPLRPLPQS